MTGMSAASRNLGVYVQLVLPTGTVLDLDGGQVMGFTVEEGTQKALLPGAVLSASLRLELANDQGQWRYGGALRQERPLVGSRASVYVVLEKERLPCGVYVIQSVSAKERGGTVVLEGVDFISTELSGPFLDEGKYPASLDAIFRRWLLQAHCRWDGILPNGDVLIDRRPTWGEISLRQAAGWIAQAAGCFIRAGRQGQLQVLPCASGETRTLTPDVYWDLRDGFRRFGRVEAVRVTPLGAKESFTLRSGDGTGETLWVERSPLFQEGAKHLQSLAAGLLSQVEGLDFHQMKFRWRGDPSVGVGSKIILTDTYGWATPCIVSRQTLKFGQGFEAECSCEVPAPGENGTVRALTPEGGLNGSALTGTVDGGLLAAGSVAAKSIAARAITAEKLDAGAVTADKLAAGAVTAGKIDAGAVTADTLDADSVSTRTAQFVSAEIQRLDAGTATASSLYAAAAHLVDLASSNISAQNVEADRLASAMVNAVNLHAASGEFDFATVQNLLAKALVLESGAAGTMEISNLTVTSANLLGAVIGKLVLRGADGGLYRIRVGSDGILHAEGVQDGDGLDVPVDSDSLDGQSAGSASAQLEKVIVKALEAEKITAGEALLASATVPNLYTSAVRALGGSMDFSANETIRLLLGQMGRMNLWFTFDDEKGLIIQKPAWTDAQGGQHPASIWRTITDETGYHIQRADMPGYVASFVRDRMVVDGAQIGGIVARRTSGGGWAWVEA